MDFERCWRNYNRRKKLEAERSTAITSGELRGGSKERLCVASAKSKDKREEPAGSWNELARRNISAELIDSWNGLDDNIDLVAKSAKEDPSSRNRRSRSPFTKVTG